MISVGIVGTGAVATTRHIPAFMRLKDVKVAAVCDRNEELAKQAAKKFTIPEVYSYFDTMLGEQNLDIVSICTPPHTHADITVKALEAGCHVLLEKPMALTIEDCDKMIKAAKKYNRKLCIIHNVLFHPPLMKAKELVAQGAIGQFTGMRIYLSDPRDEMIMRKDYWIHKLPGGLIGETGPHPTYLSLAFMDCIKSVDVFAKCILEHDWAKFDEFRIEFEGEKTMSSVIVSYSSNRYNASIDLIGTEGSLELDLQSMLVIKHGGKPALSPISVAKSSLNTSGQIISGVLSNAVNMRNMRLGHDKEIELFVESIKDNSRPPVTGQEGREVIRVMGMVVESLYSKYGK